jgi:hypothetical protein
MVSNELECKSTSSLLFANNSLASASEPSAISVHSVANPPSEQREHSVPSVSSVVKKTEQSEQKKLRVNYA